MEWTIDSEGFLTVQGQGDYEGNPDWLEHKERIKYANVSVQEITRMKDFFKSCYYLEDVCFDGTDTSQVTDMSGMFYNCVKINGIDLRGFDTAKVTTMKRMFSSCKNLNHIWMEGIDTSSVTDMSSMFSSCANLKEMDISNFNMSKVKHLGSLFYGCSSLEKISLGKPDTSQVEDMSGMFSGCKTLEILDVSELDTGNVLSMSSMFAECENLTMLDLSTFDFMNVGNTQNMFYNCSGLEEIVFGESEMANLTYTAGMFNGCRKLKQLDISTMDTSKVINMESMFMWCESMEELDVSHFDTTNVEKMKNMFYFCSKIEELDIAGFNTTNVKDMSFMFQGCSSLNELDVSEMDTGNVTDMTGMFAECKALEALDVSGFDTSKVITMNSMFKKCHALSELELGELDVSEVLNMNSMFAECKSLKTLDVSDFNCGKTTVMTDMFSGCSGLTELNVWGMNTASVKRMDGMFEGCSSLAWLTPVSDTGKVTTMSRMFYGCSSLVYLNLSDFYVQHVTTMSYMFGGCTKLQRIRFYGFFSSELENMGGMFYGCSGLEEVDLSEFDTRGVTDIRCMFYGCKSLTSVDVSNFDNSNIYATEGLFAECDNLTHIDISDLKADSLLYYDDMFKNCDKLVSVSMGPGVMEKLVSGTTTCFKESELFSEIHFEGTSAEWDAIRPLWQECTEKKLRYASIHLSDGTIEQTLQHEGNFQYIKQGGFGTQDPASYIYNCDLAKFFENSYNYQHDLAQMSIRVSMSAMSDDTHVNSSNIEALMDDLNLTKKKIHYPVPEYDSIGYAMGARRIYHNNQKKTLIMVAIRGGGYGSEWGGNANVGAGENHAGFDIAANQVYAALNQYIGELKECGFMEEGDKDIAVWISGYSRGAATANLLAAKLNDNYYMSTVMPENYVSDVESKNVFAFCFECPRNTTNEYHDHVRYNNIYNIINPKDFVTYVAMNNGIDWRFNRYGKDLVLSDEANTSGNDYAGYYANMQAVYQAEAVPEMGANQSVLAKDAAKRLGNTVSRLEYVIYQPEVQVVAVAKMANEMNWSAFLKNLIPVYIGATTKTSGNCAIQFRLLVDEIACINTGIMYAHYPEFCMAWMDTIPKEVLTKKKSFWNVFVNCPIDIYVYEEEKLVGSIIDNVPQQIENGVITLFDSNGQKQIVLPGDSEYKLVYKATADGTMTISTSKYTQAEIMPETVASYYEIPLKAGVTYESTTTEEEFKLANATGVVVEPSVMQNGEEVKIYKVDLFIEGSGEVSGINTYSIGEFAKVSAYPAEDSEFLGWYENGVLISSEKEYRFCVKNDTILTAKFVQKTKTENEIEKSEEEKTENVEKYYTIKKHTYKIIDQEKKTVSFVKTSSKSKTITIPATVMIDGNKYKVTTIEANALKGNKKVTKVKIGSNVTSIGESAFSGCKKLTKVTIGKRVTKIGKKAFYKCKKLKTITIKSKKLTNDSWFVLGINHFIVSFVIWDCWVYFWMV